MNGLFTLMTWVWCEMLMAQVNLDEKLAPLLAREAATHQLLPHPEDESEISRAKALKLALQQILIDRTRSETPLLMAEDGLKEFQAGQASESAVQDFLCMHLNRSSTRLLVYTGAASGGFPPERGESPEENWIFYLEIPSLSDHIYWIVVDKSGAQATYVYGFN